MKNRYLVGFFVLHFALSLVGFLSLNGAALAMQDAATGSGDIGWLELPLRYVLLQPLAHWVIVGLPLVWWTWPGVAALTLLLALNSLAVALALAVCLRPERFWRRRA